MIRIVIHLVVIIFIYLDLCVWVDGTFDGNVGDFGLKIDHRFIGSYSSKQ